MDYIEFGGLKMVYPIQENIKSMEFTKVQILQALNGLSFKTAKGVLNDCIDYYESYAMGEIKFISPDENL